jgi:hypothetical protein
MLELNISPDFTINDIHKIRAYNYEITKNMTNDERIAYYRRSADKIQERIDQLRKEKAITKQ